MSHAADAIRSQHAKTGNKIAALDWVDAAVYASGGLSHKDSCDYLDLTGHPAPCTCGYSAKSKQPDFIRRAIAAYEGS